MSTSKNYNVVAKVDQIVTKEVHLVISAGSEEEAEAISRQALNVYPSKLEFEDHNKVKNILTVKSTSWIPKSIDFKSVKEVNQKGSNENG